MMFSKTTRAVLAPVFFIAFTFSGVALACSTTGWDSESGMVAVGQPFGATPPDMDDVSRFEESCALVAVDTGHVQTNSPEHSEVWNRFYVLPELTGGGGTEGAAGTPILVGYSDNAATAELFNIGFDGANFTFNVTGGGSGSTAAQAGWNWIEYHWDGTTFDFWVNADATSDDPPSGSFGAAGGTLEAVQLGLPNGLGGLAGMATFDSFEMHNTTAVGPLLNCDANASGSLNFNDLATIYNELFGDPEPVLATGTPDCNYSGSINFNDLAALYNVLFP